MYHTVKLPLDVYLRSASKREPSSVWKRSSTWSSSTRSTLIHRFPKVGDFISYCRLVKCQREFAGKKSASRNNKIGNVNLKWAFSEAACLFLRGNDSAQSYQAKLVAKYGKSKALTLIAQKLARRVYSMLKRKDPFDLNRFFDNR
jgi:transposase